MLNSFSSEQYICCCSLIDLTFKSHQERNKNKQDDAKKEIIISYAKLYYEEHKNSESDMCINIADLDLSDSEKVDSNGDPFIGGVKYMDNKWQIVDSCY